MEKNKFFRKIVAIFVVGLLLGAMVPGGVVAHEPEELTLFFSYAIDSAPAGIIDSISIYWDYRTDPTIIEEKGETDLLVISWDPEMLQLVDKKVEAESEGWLATLKQYVTFWTSGAAVDSVENGVLVVKIDETIATHGAVTLKFKLLKPGTTTIKAKLIHSYSTGRAGAFNIGGEVLTKLDKPLAVMIALQCGRPDQVVMISDILTIAGYGMKELGDENVTIVSCEHQIIITEEPTIGITEFIDEIVSWWNENKDELFKAAHEFIDEIFKIIDKWISEYKKEK